MGSLGVIGVLCSVSGLTAVCAKPRYGTCKRMDPVMAAGRSERSFHSLIRSSRLSLRCFAMAVITKVGETMAIMSICRMLPLHGTLVIPYLAKQKHSHDMLFLEWVGVDVSFQQQARGRVDLRVQRLLLPACNDSFSNSIASITPLLHNVPLVPHLPHRSSTATLSLSSSST
jgi:hypothetical protein